jgi:LAS superfamily LD-carboxypeptidase LdcB
MNLYITPIKFCPHVQGKKPSLITRDMLRKVDGGGLLEKCAADAWDAMVAAAKVDGIKLTPTSSADCFRSIETQTKGFLARYSKTPLEGASTRTWNGVKWYLKKGNAPLAAPNDDAKTCSRHMLGIAVDVANANGDRLKWMHENLKKFGFSWEVVPEEPWHIRLVVAQPTPAVAEFIAAKQVGA